MTMGRLTAHLWRQFRHWDRLAKLAFGLAVLLLVPSLLMVIFGPFELRQSALIGVIGLVIVAQVIFMWANRTMVTPLTKAQRLYLDGEFAQASDLLEGLRAADKADFRALTLLGNTYRQQGMIDQSEAVLLEALDIQPNHHYPLYGFGRTLLIQGRYREAADIIEQALAAGSPPVVRLDLAEALFHSGQVDAAAQQASDAIQDGVEPHRQLMGAYLLFRMGKGAAPERSWIAAGLAYWQAEADRFADTPYGTLLADDVRAMERLMQEV